MITCSENLSESTFAAEHQTTSQTPRQGWTDGRRAPPIQMRLTDRPSFPCTLVPGSFSNGFPHAKAPTHAKREVVRPLLRWLRRGLVCGPTPRITNHIECQRHCVFADTAAVEGIGAGT